MTIKRAFIIYMESKGFGTFGTDLFLDGAAIDIKVPCWWVTASGGAPLSSNETGEKQKNYILNVYFRSENSQDVDEKIHEFEEEMNDPHCDQLEGFDTLDIQVTTFPSDQDIDVENRTVGLAQVSIRTYR